MSIDLDPFRTAARLVWTRHTVFAPHRVDDGTLSAFDALGHEIASIPLDTYTESAAYGVLQFEDQGSPITSNGVGLVWVDPETLDEVHTAVLGWCKEQFGRDDVEFPQ